MRSGIEKTKVVFFSTAFCSPRAISSFTACAISSFTAFGEKFAFFRIVRKSKDYAIFRIVRKSKDYTIKDIAQNVKCPTLTLDAEKDDSFPGQPKKVFEALSCPKKYILFT